MKPPSLEAFIIIPFLLFVSSALGGPTPKDIHLMQSIPEETELAQPDLPFSQAEWVDMFKHATSTIDIAQFYISAKASSPGKIASDDPLEPVIQELEKAAVRGVKIRILVSPNLVSQDKVTFERILKFPGIQVSLLNLSKTNHGILHAKYFVVDGRDIFVGSQNFDWRALIHIHETGVRFSDENTASGLERIFNQDWAFARNEHVPQTPEILGEDKASVELVASPPELLPPGIHPSLPALLKLIGSAKSSIQIQVMSYSLTDKYGSDRHTKWTEIDDAIRGAAGRGVHVQMMVSDWGVGSPAVDELKSLQKVPGVEIRIVSIPEARTGHIPFARVVHSKYMVIDDQALWLGTSNWEKNYFYGSRNVELIFRHPSLAVTGTRIFSKLWNSSYARKLDVSKAYVPRKQD